MCFFLSQPPHISEAAVCLNRCHSSIAFHRCRFPLRHYLTGWKQFVLLWALHRGIRGAQLSPKWTTVAEWGGIHGSHDNLTGCSPWSLIQWYLSFQRSDCLIIIYYILCDNILDFSPSLYLWGMAERQRHKQQACRQLHRLVSYYSPFFLHSSGFLRHIYSADWSVKLKIKTFNRKQNEK